MLIIPIAHSKSVKEFPWVTITLIVVCIAVWFWTLSVHNRVQQRIEAAAQLLQSALQAAPEDTCTNEEQVWVAMVMDQWALPTRFVVGRTGTGERIAVLRQLLQRLREQRRCSADLAL